MKPDKIFDILDLAKQARKEGLTFNPLFVGEAGLGKSEIIKQWVQKEQEKDPEFKFIDFRLAYYEGPDFVGLPTEVTDEDGRIRMTHALPSFWPTKGRGLILFEEPNRGNSMVLNCLMQIMTDRAVGTNYKMPDGWMIAGAINPEGAKYDVNAMDAALKDRFEHFQVDYDHNTFMHYIETNNWHQNVLLYLKQNMWVYKTPDAIAKDGKYISPRTWSKLNAAEQSGASNSPAKQQLHRIVAQSILGKHIGNEYWKACWDDSPVIAQDILKDLDEALKKLKKQSMAKSDTYAGDKIAITVESIIENYGGYYEGRDEKHQTGTITEEQMVKVAMIIPSDQSVNLIKGCGYKVHKGQVTSFFKEFYQRNKSCVAIMKDNIKIQRAVNGNKDK